MQQDMTIIIPGHLLYIHIFMKQCIIYIFLFTQMAQWQQLEECVNLNTNQNFTVSNDFFFQN